MPTPRHPELARFIEHNVLQRGDFTLASGAKSSFYLDGKILTHDPVGMVLLCDAIARELDDLGEPVDAVGGIELGATPMVGGYVTYSQLKHRPVRGFTVRKAVKDHGTKKRVEGYALQAGDRVVVFEDVVTTGAALLDSLDAIDELDCQIVAAISIVDRRGGASEKLAKRGITYRPLVTLEDLHVTAPTPR